ncbi:MarR family transcriptional regulator [Streptomyces sp. NPDC008150]|uniref:MarR family winged helix-turn-helix transcriptional regulator n=1 Tax=Streptomyces sp. NPDC008150 TaxID=3364816 RepID=UPI0036E6C3CF
MPHDATPPAPSAPAEPSAPSGSASAAAPDLGLVDGLVQLSFLVQGTLAKVAAEHGLTVVQLRLLGVLRDRTPGMQELARHLGLDKSSMTGLVDRAERRGLVRRTPSPDDRRGVRVSLTDEGRALARTGAGEAGRRVTELAAGLTGPQRAQLSRLASELLAGAATL